MRVQEQFALAGIYPLHAWEETVSHTRTRRDRSTFNSNLSEIKQQTPL